MASGPRTATNGQIERQPKPPEQSLAAMLGNLKGEMARALPKHVSPDRMNRIALTALRTNKDLARCSPGSFLGSVLSAAQLGLEVNTPLGHAYLIPYKGECTLQLGYQGMMDLARRSGSVKAIYAHPVYEGDTFSVKLGLEQSIEHVPSDEPDREDKPLTHVYAVAKLRDGEPVFVVLTRAQIDRYRQRSRASSNGPWVTDYVAMAMKTAVRRLFTWLPKSAEMAQAAAVDEAPEIGQPQSEAWDPAVTEALQTHGVEVVDVDPPSEPQAAANAPGAES